MLAPVINELHFNPLFGSNAADQYVELRGVPNETLPNGTYLVVVDGDAGGNAPGEIHTLFDLSGLVMGDNGFLVLAQQGSNYAISPEAAVLTGTSGGFGGLRAPGDPPTANRFEDDTNLPNVNQIDFIVGSNTFFLIQTATKPQLTGDIDANNDGAPDALVSNWTVLDAVSVLDGGANDLAYANLVFASGGMGVKPVGAQVVSTSAVSWVGRNDDTTGSAPADWIVGQTQERGANSFVFRLNNNSAVPPAFAGRNLNHLGAPNFGATILGTVFQDNDADGVQDAGENGLPNFPVYVDHNANGTLDPFTTQVEPDDFSQGTVVQNLTPGVTLTVTGDNNAQFPEDTIRVTVVDDPAHRSTGTRVFAHSDISFFETNRRLRIDFYEPARSLSIDIIGASLTPTVGRLRIYNAAGVELDTLTTAPLADGQVATMTLTRPAADIAYAVAYSEPGTGNSPFGRLDNLRFSQPERQAISGANGAYEIRRVFPGQHRVRQVAQPGFLQTFPANGGPHVVNIVNTADAAEVDFGNRPNQGPQIAPQQFTVNENSGAGVVVGTVVAQDGDAGQALTFEIVGGSGQGKFNLHATTGQITVAPAANLNFEDVASYTLNVRVRDNAANPASATATMTINLTDVNEAPTALTLSTTAIEEDADTDGGLVVGTLALTDPDAVGSPTYTLVNGAGATHNNLFEIVSGQLRVKAGTTLDHETQPSLAVRIKAVDGPHMLERMFTIAVNDANEPPTEITLSGDSVVDSADNGVEPVTVGDLSVVDPDDPTAYAPFTFALEQGEGGEDNAVFQVEEGRLQFKADVSLDSAVQDAYAVRLRADDGVHSLTRTFVIHVTAQPEGPPWQNPETPEDADGNGSVELFDLLLIVDFLREHGVSHTLEDEPEEDQPKVDVNGDGTATLFDLLIVVEYLRTQQTGDGEPEPDLASEGDGQFTQPLGPALLVAEDDDPWDAVLEEVARDVAQTNPPASLRGKLAL